MQHGLCLMNLFQLFDSSLLGVDFWHLQSVELGETWRTMIEQASELAPNCDEKSV
jgi:hypothetical protein